MQYEHTTPQYCCSLLNDCTGILKMIVNPRLQKDSSSALSRLNDKIHVKRTAFSRLPGFPQDLPRVRRYSF